MDRSVSGKRTRSLHLVRPRLSLLSAPLSGGEKEKGVAADEEKPPRETAPVVRTSATTAATGGEQPRKEGYGEGEVRMNECGMYVVAANTFKQRVLGTVLSVAYCCAAMSSSCRRLGGRHQYSMAADVARWFLDALCLLPCIEEHMDTIIRADKYEKLCAN